MTENGNDAPSAGARATGPIPPSAPAKRAAPRRAARGTTATPARSRRAATPGPVTTGVRTDTTSVPAGRSTAADRALRAAEQARSAGDARAAARGRADRERGLLGASVHLPFVRVSVAVPQGAQLHVGPVDVGLGPRGIAVVGAAGALAVGVIEWPVAAAAVAAGVVLRRFRGSHR